MVNSAFHEQIRELLAEKKAPERRILDEIYAKRPALTQKYQKSLRHRCLCSDCMCEFYPDFGNKKETQSKPH